MKSAKSISITLVAFAVFCLLAVAIGQDTSSPKPPAGGRPGKPALTTDNEATIKQKLSKVIEKAEFKNIPLDDAIKFLGNAAGVNIYVKWGVLEGPGIEKTTAVNVDLKNVTYKKALEVVLECAGGGTSFLLYTIDQGVVTISTKEDMNTRTVTKVYQVGDLNCETRKKLAGSNGRPWLKSFFKVGEERVYLGEEDLDGIEYALCSEVPHRLEDLIYRTVDPNSWAVNEGEIGRIEVEGRNLIITQTLPNHEAIARLLGELRRDRLLDVGFAVVRMGSESSQGKLGELIKAGGDIKAALVAGESKGLWTLDRCDVDQAAFGEVIGADCIYAHHIEEGFGGGEGLLVLELSEKAGYEIGVLARHRTEKGVMMSVACGSGWYAKGHDPKTDTPRKNTGVTCKHTTFNFTLAGGETKTFPVIPFGVCGDAAVVVVWLPKL